MSIAFFDHGYGVFDRTRRIGPAKWDRFDLIWLHEGKIELTLLQRHSVTITKGSGILLYPQTHFVGRSVSRSARASVQHFNLSDDASNIPVPFGRLLGKHEGFETFSRAPKGLEIDIERSMDLADQRQTKLVHDMRVALLAIILGGLSGSEGAREDDDEYTAAFEKLFDHFDRNLQRAISLEEMAEQVGMSTSHFRATFRKRFGLSPGRYLTDLRMRRACELLRETALPIKTIAQRVGFDELPNFYRAFRQMYKQTPATFRRQTALRG